LVGFFGGECGALGGAEVGVGGWEEGVGDDAGVAGDGVGGEEGETFVRNAADRNGGVGVFVLLCGGVLMGCRFGV